MFYYLQVATSQAIIGFQSSPKEITQEDAGSACFLEIPENNSSLLGWRFLGVVTPGVTALGADYLSQFEAPPAPGCYWDGSEWVCPDAAVA